MSIVPEPLRFTPAHVSEEIRSEVLDRSARMIVTQLWTWDVQGGDVPFDGVVADLHGRILGIIGWERPEMRRRDRGAVLAPQVRREVFERDDYRCVSCGSHRDVTIDHITARANGGSDELGNLQTLCRPCNSRKGAR